MPTLRFESEAGALLAEVEAMPGDLLLDVARLADVPLHWRCGQGTCGTCKVRLARLDGAAYRAEPGRKERNVLLRAGAIDNALAAGERWPPATRHWRLACHLAVGDENWRVECPSF
nr:2Fe-2S iron-sulfur cluster-binding protein [Chromobacterium sp. ASV5]